MSIKTNYNGGFEQGLLEIAKEEDVISENDSKRLDYLKSLPQNQYVEKVIFTNPLDFSLKEYISAAEKNAIGEAKKQNRIIAKSMHKLAFIQALKEGKYIPPERLEEYQKLNQKKNKGRAL